MRGLALLFRLYNRWRLYLLRKGNIASKWSSGNCVSPKSQPLKLNIFGDGARRAVKPSDPLSLQPTAVVCSHKNAHVLQPLDDVSMATTSNKMSPGVVLWHLPYQTRESPWQQSVTNLCQPFCPQGWINHADTTLYSAERSRYAIVE